MGAEGFHGRVRNGVGWGTLAMTTSSSEHTRDGRTCERGRSGPIRPVRCARVSSGQVFSGHGGVLRTEHGWFGEKRWPAARLFGEEHCWRGASSLGLLGSVSSTHCCASTSDLSTWWSSTALMARPGFEVGFPLRCFQRLSLPYIATQLCRWHDNWSTRGTSTPVLSY